MSLMTSPAQLARQHFTAMETGDPAAARAAIHPQHINYEAPDHPAASAIAGLPGFLATSAWLRSAFSDLHFEILDLVAGEDCTIAHVTMSGRQTGPFVVFPPGRRPVAFLPTGAQFTVRQCHIFTTRDGLHATHAAVRDDLGMLTQLGHLPPSPAAAARMARWTLTGGARRAIRQATVIADTAAAAA
jgi:predicted ester cyclase